MSKDPVCGMTVEEETAAASAEHEGKTWYFCSEHCQTKFKAAPEQYTAQENLTDPVCGMSVTADSEHHHQHDDKDYYFCSASCHDKFTAADRSGLRHDCHHRQRAPPPA